MWFGYILLSLLVNVSPGLAGREGTDSRPSLPIVEEEYDTTLESFKLSPQDRQAVFGDTTIIKRLRVTDCHSAIAKQLEGRCSSSKDHMEPNEAYRSDLAISLTLCSLASAMQTVPSDCEAWYRSTQLGEAESTSSWMIWRMTANGRAPSARSACLSALHRSPQDWTSYNQYLSDATLLCSALRADWQMNRARELYANATMEKISLISLLRTNEEARREDSDRLSGDMSNGLKETRKNAETTSDTLEAMQREITRQEAVRTSMIAQLERGLSVLVRAGDGVWDDIRKDGAEMAMSLVQDMRQSHADMMMDLSQQLRSSLSGLAYEHGNSLKLHNRRLGEDTDLMITKLADSFAIMAGETTGHLDILNDKLALSSSEAAVLQENVLAGARIIHESHPALLSSAKSAVVIQDHHNQTLASLLESRLAAITLSEELERSLEVISQTIAMAQQSNSRSRWTLISPSLFSVSAFSLPEGVLKREGLLGLVGSILVGLLQILVGLIGYIVQLLGLTIGILISITTTVYAALHSRARLPIRRFLKRLETQLSVIADDLGGEELKHTSNIRQKQSTKAPSLRRTSKSKAAPSISISTIKEEIEDRPKQEWVEPYGPVVLTRSRAGLGDINSFNSSGRSVRTEVLPRYSRAGTAPL